MSKARAALDAFFGSFVLRPTISMNWPQLILVVVDISIAALRAGDSGCGDFFLVCLVDDFGGVF